MNIDFHIIEYGTSEYDRMVDLRNKILREPLGLVFTEAEKERDKRDILLGAFFAHNEQILACCVLTPITDVTVQLRQMAVSDFCQGKGVGSQLLSFAESVAKERGFSYVYLHAREVALAFYKKHDYTIEGDKFIEVGIPHFEMLKNIDKNNK